MNKRQLARLGLQVLGFFGLFCLGLVSAFALAGIFGYLIQGFAWAGTFVAIIWGFGDLLSHIRGH